MAFWQVAWVLVGRDREEARLRELVRLVARDDRPTAAAKLGTLAEIPIKDNAIRNQSPWLVLAGALAEERDGRPDLAFEVLVQMMDPDRDFDVGDRFRWTPELVRLALAVDERDAAEDAARVVAKHPTGMRA